MAFSGLFSAPKAMAPILLSLPMMLKADAGGLTVEVEPSH
jgi:hypothetical protein